MFYAGYDLGLFCVFCCCLFVVFVLVVCWLFFCMVSDFSDFWKFWALSWCAGASATCESREARRDSRHEQTVRFAKVPNLFFPLFVCLVLYCMVSDFSHFSKSRALSYRAVRGLYSLRLNHKMPVRPAGLKKKEVILLLDLGDVGILIMLSYEIRAWYWILTRKRWGVKPSLFCPLWGIQANNYILRRLIISC